MRKTALPLTTSCAVFLLLLSSCAYDSARQVAPTRGGSQRLNQAQQAVQGALNAIARDLSDAAETLARTDLDSPEARQTLARLCAKHPYAIDCATVDASGRIVVVEPKAYQKAEGADISLQEHIVRLHDIQLPVMSQVFRSVEGYWAIDVEHPIVSPNGDFIGSVSILFQPTVFLSRILEPRMGGDPWSAWVMQINGLVLYDPDPEEVGRNVFTDPLYEQFDQLRTLCKRVAQEPFGTGKYRFLGTGLDITTTKRCSWKTVSLHGAQWRIVVVRENL